MSSGAMARVLWQSMFCRQVMLCMQVYLRLHHDRAHWQACVVDRQHHTGRGQGSCLQHLHVDATARTV